MCRAGKKNTHKPYHNHEELRFDFKEPAKNRFARYANGGPKQPFEIVRSEAKSLAPNNPVIIFELEIKNNIQKSIFLTIKSKCCAKKFQMAAEKVSQMDHCISIVLIGKRKYKINAQETTTITLLYASVNLLLQNYQFKGRCKFDIISEKAGAVISCMLPFKTRSISKEDEPATLDSSADSGYKLQHSGRKYTGWICNNDNCLPIDCAQATSSKMNFFDGETGECIRAPACAANNTFFNIMKKQCQNYRFSAIQNLKDDRNFPHKALHETKSPYVDLERIQAGNLEYASCSSMCRSAKRYTKIPSTIIPMFDRCAQESGC
ncbi:Hypothetical predicted protein [Octopus vulgaris]|uniref:Uncharacterized protein n=1 Tax=Octopus vulgaris TaxID=6645 RepID=A0AA36F0K7_OCTVU|nr:Hypothetical predicted protein [Octopus vulgaris]